MCCGPVGPAYTPVTPREPPTSVTVVVTIVATAVVLRLLAATMGWWPL